MTHSPDTPLLDTVKVPSDLRNLAASQLRQLADELRADQVIDIPLPFVGWIAARAATTAHQVK